MKFYRCKKCGKAVAVLGESGEDMFCRNAEIEELIPNTTDAAGEKHVPVITKDGSKVHVAVGAVEHPMLESHYITWIVLETKNGSQQVDLKPGMKPVADFVLAEGDEVVAARMSIAICTDCGEENKDEEVCMQSLRMDL